MKWGYQQCQPHGAGGMTGHFSHVKLQHSAGLEQILDKYRLLLFIISMVGITTEVGASEKENQSL